MQSGWLNIRIKRATNLQCVRSGYQISVCMSYLRSQNNANISANLKIHFPNTGTQYR